MPLDQAAAEASRRVPGHFENQLIGNNMVASLSKKNTRTRATACAPEPSSAPAMRRRHCHPRAATDRDAPTEAARAAPGIEPGISRTRSENHATRPSSHLPLVGSSHSRTNPSKQSGRQLKTTIAAVAAKGRAHCQPPIATWAGNANSLPAHPRRSTRARTKDPPKPKEGHPIRGLIAQLVRAYG